MKKTPSIGFVYLLSVLIGFGMFLFWVLQLGWYDRIHNPKQTDADLACWADYLEEIVNDFDDSQKRVEILVEAARLRRRVAQPEIALRLLEKAMALNPDDEALNPLLLPLYWESGRKIKALRIAKKNLTAGQRDADTLSVLLASVAGKMDSGLVLNVIQAVLETDLPDKQVFGDGQIVALGLTEDLWTHDGKPCFLVVSDSKVSLKLACHAGLRYTPVSVTIEDQYEKIIFSHVFESPGNLEVELPRIPVGESRLFIIKTDKFWIPAKNDNRKLGVRVAPFIQKQ